MDQKLRWGLLSTARINSVLIPPIRGSRRNQLAAVASRSPDKAGAFARKWNIPRALGTYEALLADPEIDVIYIPLPNHLHAEWAIKAMRAGKHVLCEKPLALSAQEVDAMAATARETGRVLAEAFMYRHLPQTLKARELVESGVLGKIHTLRGTFSFPLNTEEDIRWEKEKGGGSVWDVGCYPVNYIRYLVGAEPLEVFGWQILEKRGCDETFIGQMRFPGGVLAQFDSGFRSPPRTNLEVAGSQGTLNIPIPFKPGRRGRLLLTLGGKQKTIRVTGQELYGGEVEDMADAVLLGRAPRISLEDSRGNVLVIESLLKSASSGEPVKI
jgi:D-xylose 1-dehydrogenase (NADP+, D-xylono-1,5-lactone-forming)